MAGLQHSRSWFWSFRILCLDLLTLAFCGILSSELRGFDVPFLNFTVFDGLAVVVTCLLCLSVVGGYERNRDMCTLRYSSEHMLAMGAALVIAFIFTYSFANFNDETKPGRSVLFLALILFTPLSLLYRRVLFIKANRNAAERFICVVGAPELASRLELVFQETLFRHPLRLMEVVPGGELSPSDQSQLLKILSGKIDDCEAIVIDLRGGRLELTLEELLFKINLHAVPVYPVESFIETYFQKIDLSHVTLSSALDGTFKADHHSAYGKLKNLIDVALGLFLFVALLPLMLLTGLVVLLADSTPVLFKQVRVGRFNSPFTLYKFRTMTVNATESGGLYTLKNDRRVTKVGRFLRLTRLDELPQLWNVVRGDMSIIGPRAEWDRLVETYRKEIPFYHLRYIVKPGITGWAQVNYGYGADVRDAFEKLQYDLYYIKHCSPQMDASIILKTLFTILSASGR